MKSFIKSFYSFLDFRPPAERQPDLASVIPVDNQSYFKDLLVYIKSKNDMRPFFLVGPWGSGKTVAIRLLSLNGDSVRPVIRNFAGVVSLADGYRQLLPLQWRVLNFMLIFSCWLLALSQDSCLFGMQLKNLEAVLIGGLGSYLITMLLPRLRLAMGLSFVPRLLCLKLFGQNRPIVIEDLDRSCLTGPERLSFLGQLPYFLEKMVIAYGYSSDAERASILEFAQKFNAHISILSQSPQVTHAILTKIYKDFPFQQPAFWMGILSVRRHLRVIDDAVENL